MFPSQPLGWQMATVIELVEETPRARSILLDIQDWRTHRPGQHIDLRLTTRDGHQTRRCYSIASAPGDEHVVLTVERLEGGVVSSYLVDELRVGNRLDVRGPVNDYFAWRNPLEDPLLLVAGGPGIAPVRSMLRHHGAVRSTVPVRMLYSAPSHDEVIYHDELLRIAARDEMDVSITLTRTQPEGWHGYRRPVDRELLDEVGWPPGDRPLVYVCGPTGFVDAATSALVALGHDPSRIQSERFGRAG
jgi:ferredoxin-NADP reductase